MTWRGPMEMGHGRFIVDVLQKRGHIVGMTGNGVNDAPALAQADLGSAIGAGSDVVVETIDVMLVRSNPLDLVALLNLSKAQSCSPRLNPALAAMLMLASTVIVAINARLLRLTE
jgi:Cu2+-exporting ATPase